MVAKSRGFSSYTYSIRVSHSIHNIKYNYTNIHDCYNINFKLCIERVLLSLSVARPESRGDTSVSVGLSVASDASSTRVDKRKSDTGEGCSARGGDEFSPDTLSIIASNASVLPVYIRGVAKSVVVRKQVVLGKL